MFEGPGKSSAPRAISTENARKDETQKHVLLRVFFFGFKERRFAIADPTIEAAQPPDSLRTAIANRRSLTP
jgi:hypothetical protein